MYRSIGRRLLIQYPTANHLVWPNWTWKYKEENLTGLGIPYIGAICHITKGRKKGNFVRIEKNYR